MEYGRRQPRASRAFKAYNKQKAQVSCQRVNNTSVWTNTICPTSLTHQHYPMDTYTSQWEDSHNSTFLSMVAYSRSSSRTSLVPSISELSHISSSSSSSTPRPHNIPEAARRYSTPRKYHPHCESPPTSDFMNEDSDTDLSTGDLIDMSQLRHKLHEIQSMIGDSSGYHSRSATESSDSSVSSIGSSRGSLPPRPPCEGQEDPQVHYAIPTRPSRNDANPTRIPRVLSDRCEPCDVSMDSDATTFMQRPLVRSPVAPVKKSRRSIAKKLRRIGRSIKRCSHEGLGLVTLAVL